MQKYVMAGTIGLFLRSSDNDYQHQLKELGQREAQKHDFELVVESARNDAARQVEQIRAAIQTAGKKNLLAILVSSVRDDVLPELAEEAAAAGVDFALLNEWGFVEEIRAHHKDRAIFVATPDQTEIGRIHGRQVRSLVPGRSKILCVTGPMNTRMAQERLRGLKEVLADDYSLIEIHGDWTSERARMSVDKWASGLSSTDDLPAMFVAHNDEMALGIRQALRDATTRGHALDAAFITGCDGSMTYGQRLVNQERIKATVIMPPTSGAAIEWIARSRSRGEAPPAHVVLPVTPFPAVADLQK